MLISFIQISPCFFFSPFPYLFRPWVYFFCINDIFVQIEDAYLPDWIHLPSRRALHEDTATDGVDELGEEIVVAWKYYQRQPDWIMMDVYTIRK